jgi:hypothetical protein
MANFLVFPEDMVGVKEALQGYSAFQGYPWIVYGETHRQIHLGFNGEDIGLTLEWYNTGYDAAFASSDSLVRVRVSLSQKRNPVPRAKGERRKKYPIWIPSRHEERYYAWEKVPAELPRVLLTSMFDRKQKARLKTAYAELAAVFPPPVGHEEVHSDTGYLESIMIKEERGSFQQLTRQLDSLLSRTRMHLEISPGEIFISTGNRYTSDGDESDAIIISEDGEISGKGEISFLGEKERYLIFSLPDQEAIFRSDAPPQQFKKLDFDQCYNFPFIVQTFPDLARYSIIEEILDLMNEYYGVVEHKDTHTDTGYLEGNLSALIAKEEKIFAEAPQVLRRERPIEHGDVHTDTGYHE